MNQLRRFAVVFAVFMLASCSADDASLGIIGGADGPTAIVVASKAETLAEMPAIDGIPTPPGDFESASQSEKSTFIETENVTEVMWSEYTGLLQSEGFSVVDVSADKGMTAMVLESEKMTVSLVLNDSSLTTTVTEK